MTNSIQTILIVRPHANQIYSNHFGNGGLVAFRAVLFGSDIVAAICCLSHLARRCAAVLTTGEHFSMKAARAGPAS